jgi:hypothetical protein
MDAFRFLPPTPFIHPSISKSHEHVQLFKDGILVQQYPRTFIKSQFRQTNSQKLNQKIVESYQEQFPNSQSLTEVSIKKALKLATSLSDSTHFLDARYINEEKFRKNLILNKLPTLETIHSWNTAKKTYAESNHCTSCTEGITETVQHIWNCPATVKAYQDILEQAEVLLKYRYKIARNQPLFQLFSMKLGIAKPLFLTKLHQAIFFPEELIDHYTNILTEQYKAGPKKDISDMFHMIFDCFLSAFYSIIWSPRSRRIHSGKDPPKSPAPPNSPAPSNDDNFSGPSSSHERPQPISSRTRSKLSLRSSVISTASSPVSSANTSSQSSSSSTTQKRKRDPSPFFKNRRPARLLLQQSSPSSSTNIPTNTFLSTNQLLESGVRGIL